MKSITLSITIIAGSLLFFACSSVKEAKAQSQEASSYLSDYTASFLSHKEGKLALMHAKLIDGTGSPAQEDQTVLIDQGRILKVGPSQEVSIPPGFKQLDLKNKTLIPGFVGTHNHMRMHRSALLSSSPRLYLACGVTTIQTCGTGNAREEIAIAQSIRKGEQAGPEIINSAPYFTGPAGKPHFIRFTDEKMVRDTIRYWADQGVKWLKVYRHTRPQDLAVIVDEAHKLGLKVAGHLCATTYTEAAEIGIDAIEHGFIESYDHAEGREAGICGDNRDFRDLVDVESEEVKAVQQKMIRHGVALSSTLSLFEALGPNAEADPRELAVLSAGFLEVYQNRQKRKKAQGSDWWFKEAWFEKCLQYDIQYYRMGGLLVSGSDPEAHILPGFGDQKNYEIFIRAGLQAEEALQIMCLNGAKLLEREDLGSIEEGKVADIQLIDGDLEKNPRLIRKLEMVIRKGMAYDPEKLLNSLKGSLGSETDDQMTYLGQKAPGNQPELFAPHLISKTDRHEFGCYISKDGKEFFFAVDAGERNEIYHTRWKNAVWTPAEKLFPDSLYSYNDPLLNHEENRLYFISNRPLPGSKEAKDIDIWYVERQGNSWSEAINVGAPINSPLNEYYISFSKEGHMYFASRSPEADAPQYAYDIYRAAFDGSHYSKAEKLPAEINTPRYEADPFIAPDESYLIFGSARRGGYGQGDLYISFKDKNGNWTQAQNMGDKINTELHELCPIISPDGKYLFFTSNQDIYWVSTEILKSYKQGEEE
ncbi:MAG: amidohydrolase family protein [Bacteroidia bacterium]|nr:amidohydrolase family protein [Bacteroidia bacterium]